VPVTASPQFARNVRFGEKCNNIEDQYSGMLIPLRDLFCTFIGIIEDHSVLKWTDSLIVFFSWALLLRACRCRLHSKHARLIQTIN